MIADIAGANDKLAVMERRYQSQIALIREVIDTKTIMVSTLHAQSKSFFAFNPYFNIGKVLLDAGFQRPAAIEAIPDGDRIDVSAEALQEFDGDFIKTTYRSSRQQYPDAVTGYMESLFPGFCVQLHACREGQMIYLSRAEAAATSYYALGAVASAILTSLGGRTVLHGSGNCWNAPFAVMLYVRFPLSLRNVEDLRHERGIEISHETVRFWWNSFGPLFAAEIRRKKTGSATSCSLKLEMAFGRGVGKKQR